MKDLMTGKEFRKELKRIFKKYDLDNKHIEIFSGYLMSFLVSDVTFEEFIGDAEGSEARAKIEEWYKNPRYAIKYDHSTGEIYLEEKTENKRLK